MRIPGYHFLPDEKELIFYLQKRVRGDDGDQTILEIDIYGDKKPWEMFNKDVKKYYYVFTKLKKKGNSAHRIDRTAGTGTWKERQMKGKDKNNIHWTRKEFFFELDKKIEKEPCHGSFGNGHWIMYEYSLPGGGKPNDYVICKIKNKYASEQDYGPDGLEGIGRLLAQIRFLDEQAVENQDNANKRKLHAEEEGQQQLLKKKRTSNNYSLQCSNHEANSYVAPPTSDPALTIQFAEQVQQQFEMQSSSNYNLVCGNGDSYALLPDPQMDPVAKLMSTEECLQEFEMQNISNTNNGNTNFFSAPPVDQITMLTGNVNFFSSPATVPSASPVFADQQQLKMQTSHSSYSFECRNGEGNFFVAPPMDQTATPMLAAEQTDFMEQLGAILPSLLAENEQLTEMLTSTSTSATYYQQMFDDLPEFHFPDTQNPNST